MVAKRGQPKISNQAKKTRDQPNLTDCNSCGLRISSNKRLQILYSEWRIILLCRECLNLVKSSKICSYCFKESSGKSKCFRCCQCKRVVHESCFAKRNNVSPWSYSCYDGGGGCGGFSVCVDCWLPKSVAVKRAEVGRVSKRNDTRVSGKSLEDVVKDANCAAQEKVEVAVRARKLALRKALEAKAAADVAREALDLVANNNEGVKENNNNVDDFELAFRLHRAMNSSPRISSNLCLLNSSCLDVARIGEGNGETRIRNSDFSNLGSCWKPEGSVSRRSDMEHQKSNENDDGIIQPYAKKDGNVDMQLKQGEVSKLINSREDDHIGKSDSQSYREGNESMTPENKGYKRDRYLLKYSRKKVLFKYSRRKFMLKYSRRKKDERLFPGGRPKFPL